MNNSTIIEAIHKCEPWNGSFAFPLQEFKFKDIKKVWKILITLSSHSNFGTLFPKFFKSFIKELAKETTKSKNVKLGFGGLADIEFTVQVLQMVHGKKSFFKRNKYSYSVRTI